MADSDADAVPAAAWRHARPARSNEHRIANREANIRARILKTLILTVWLIEGRKTIIFILLTIIQYSTDEKKNTRDTCPYPPVPCGDHW